MTIKLWALKNKNGQREVVRVFTSRSQARKSKKAQNSVVRVSLEQGQLKEV